MYIGRVTGSIVATVKDEVFEGRKLLLVHRLDLNDEETNYYDIAVDFVQAGVGDKVIVVDEGNAARQILRREVAAVRAVIVGVVDDIDLAE